MIELISVIICTCNPDATRLNKTLDGLKHQTLPYDKWELIIIDNNSSYPVTADLTWQPDNKIIPELKPGLTYARIRGFSEAKGTIIIMVDDDNVLDKDYLLLASGIFKNQEKLGAIGGKIIPDFEAAPPVWLKEFYGLLALRNLGPNVIVNSWNNIYPEAAPVGAGMAIRKLAVQNYVDKIIGNKSPVTDRQGTSLSSGGDNDIVLEILKQGWEIGYFPQLSLKHIIPENRMKAGYLALLNESSNRSWIRVLQSHQINPWPKIAPWTISLRKLKSWLSNKVWLNDVNYIKWKGSCGMFDALADSDK